MLIVQRRRIRLVQVNIFFITKLAFCFKKMFSFIVRPRKRAIRYKTHKAFISKTLVERGLEHVTKKKRKLIPQKVFGVQSSCKCSKGKKKKLNCNEKITAARQKQIFESYYEEMSWTQSDQA